MEIKIEHQPTQERLNELGVSKWEIWKRKFPNSLGLMILKKLTTFWKVM